MFILLDIHLSCPKIREDIICKFILLRVRSQNWKNANIFIRTKYIDTFFCASFDDQLGCYFLRRVVHKVCVGGVAVG